MKIMLNDINYELIKNYKDAFNYDLVMEKCTDYFNEYDYIFGDFSYDKLRLKGYNDPKNKNCNEVNNIETLDEYIKEYCSYECRYFLLKKVNN